MMDREKLRESFIKAKRALFDKFYGAKLNPEQRRAVFTVNGPLLVLAGAGSGKTTVLVNRIVYLIKYGNAYFSEELPEWADESAVEALEIALQMDMEGIESILPQFICEPSPPWQVLAFTFTNKAAGEIKERLLAAFGDKDAAESIWAGTFHSVCMRILRKFGERVGYRPGFSIYDTDDKKRMISQCMDELRIDEKRLAAKAVASAISMAKDNLQSPDQMEVTLDPRTRDIREIYALYQKRMMANNALDFDDIIMMTVRLLENEADVREYYQNKFRYVLVDEYQDTNYAQFVLTTLLSGGRRNLMVVGDDDQSIYRFRGATIENILKFDVNYKDATVIKLEQNYRSTGNILGAANAIIANNDKRHSKRLWCDKGEGEKITLKEAQDQNDEGRYIIETISSSVRRDKRKYSDFAVLYRVNAMGRALQSSFVKSGIPFRVIGDMRFYDRKEVKDMVAYLTLVSAPMDNLRLKRVINEPKRKIGTATVEAIERIANELDISMMEVIRRADEFSALAKSRDKLASFLSVIDSVRDGGGTPSSMIRELFERTGYRAMLLAEGFEGESKIENVEELISAAVEYEGRMSEAEGEATLQGFLEEVSLISDVDKYDEDSDTVILMTVHAAKGLEFPVVFLAGMEDGIFPSDQSRDDAEEMSEERRLAYVAITRAKEKLYITYARSRMMYGRTMYGMLSCFIRSELPEGYIQRDRPRQIPPRQTYQQGGYYKPKSEGDRRGYTELNRRPDSMGGAKAVGAKSFGIVKMAPGTRVNHATFGDGVILSSRDFGGDVLYEVKFDDGQVKKLMATFAKLRRL